MTDPANVLNREYKQSEEFYIRFKEFSKLGYK